MVMYFVHFLYQLFFFFKQKTAYEMRISDWSSDVCSSDLVLAGSGLCYLLLVAPRLLPVRGPMPGVVEEQSRHFIAQLSVTQGSRLVGLTAIGGIFPALKDITVLMVQRGAHSAVPPYEDLRSEERRVGKECVSTGRSGGWRYH